MMRLPGMPMLPGAQFYDVSPAMKKNRFMKVQLKICSAANGVVRGNKP